MTALAVLAALGLVAPLVFVAVRRRSIKAYAAGRRHQHAGRVDRDRLTDSAYLDGALTEFLHRTESAR